MKHPIRVLMLFTIMNRGGAETMVMNYYRHIDRRKVQFDFMVHRQERGAYDDEIERLGGKIYRMLPLHPLYFGKYKKQIAQFFDEHPEYRIIHGHCSESGYFIYQEAARRGVPVIIAHAHNSHALLDAKWPFRTWFKVAMRPYITQGFTCGKEAARWLLGKTNGDQAILQRNAIDTQSYLFSQTIRNEMRTALHIPEHATVIGHVGRFNRQKNHVFVLDIFAQYVRTHTNSYLLLVGTGELQTAIRQKVTRMGLTEQVFFLNTRSDVHRLLQAMDVFLFPSFMEGFSVSMVEAQSTGLPCIASDRIPHEVALTDLVSFLSLKDTPQKWSEYIDKKILPPCARTVYANKVAQAGYDIVQNAQWLQDYYLKVSK